MTTFWENNIKILTKFIKKLSKNKIFLKLFFSFCHYIGGYNKSSLTKNKITDYKMNKYPKRFICFYFPNREESKKISYQYFNDDFHFSLQTLFYYSNEYKLGFR